MGRKHIITNTCTNSAGWKLSLPCSPSAALLSTEVGGVSHRYNTLCDSCLCCFLGQFSEEYWCCCNNNLTKLHSHTLSFCDSDLLMYRCDARHSEEEAAPESQGRCHEAHTVKPTPRKYSMLMIWHLIRALWDVLFMLRPLLGVRGSNTRRRKSPGTHTQCVFRSPIKTATMRNLRLNWNNDFSNERFRKLCWSGLSLCAKHTV